VCDDWRALNIKVANVSTSSQRAALFSRRPLRKLFFATRNPKQGSQDAAEVYFYVDITVTVPQYLGCKKATVLLIGYQMETGNLISIRRTITHGNQEKSCKEKKEKVSMRGAKSPHFQRENSYDGCSPRTPFFNAPSAAFHAHLFS
jgi:hypothetical protein